MFISFDLAFLLNKKITEIRLDVYDENTAAKNAYLKVGFKPILLQMRLDME